MSETITIRVDAETEHALRILTHGGVTVSSAVRQAVLQEAMRHERAEAMRRAVLEMSLGEEDGVTIAEEIAHFRLRER